MTEGFGVMPSYAAAGAARGPLGDRGLHPRPPAQPERRLAELPPDVRQAVETGMKRAKP